ncbi:dynamin family protein [Actinobacillus genomosp. 1]|uniref:dynamin family protein n=1 Tax=Actinobacillus genomosp. 1 TaxID=254839 RepID=UPI0024431AE8|nr:dynamin family protein [Actinobacillus genomosp. 1]WGE92027.1 dynamin family protein [Actinobacillus genomosp. 1]
MNQNISQQLVEFNNKLLTFLTAKNLNEVVEIQNKKSECHITESKELQASLDEVNNIDRLLRIGIIGRVKAGKSSLLNALVFNGRDVLPKAATPMTAALTRMEYSENVRAEIEFYDQADLDLLAEKSHNYEEEFNKIKTKHLLELKQENTGLKKLSHLLEARSLKEMEQLAKNFARTEMEKSIELSSAYDQYQRIKSSQTSLAELTQNEITASSTEDLMGKLHQYVGSDGKYMPFTKSVKLYIPEEGLKGLEIVDTPGVNDPVQSREQRTNEFLAQCDVVLVISPAGQFLSSEDMELMGRVTAKNGIQEAYIIASQIDSQLFGSAKGNNISPRSTLEHITQILNLHTEGVFSKINAPEMQNMVELYRKNSVICTSSVAFTMLQTFNKQTEWDNNTQKVWENLNQHYPDFFSDKDTAKIMLEELSNIEKIKQILVDVQNRKEEIQIKKQKDLVTATIKNYQEFTTAISDYIADRIDEINFSNIENKRQELHSFKEQKEEYHFSLDENYRRAILHFEECEGFLAETLDREIKGFSETNKIRTESSYETRYRENNGLTNLWGLFGDRYTSYEVQVEKDVINASAVRDYIQNLRSNISNKLKKAARNHRTEWEDTVVSNIFSGIRDVNRNYPNCERLKRTQVNNTVQAIFRQIKVATFTINDSLPESLNKSGTLKDNDARQFNEDASSYMYKNFIPLINSDIEQYTSSNIENLKNFDLSNGILNSLEKQISQLIYEIENKEEFIERYKRMNKDLSNLKVEIPNA